MFAVHLPFFESRNSVIKVTKDDAVLMFEFLPHPPESIVDMHLQYIFMQLFSHFDIDGLRWRVGECFSFTMSMPKVSSPFDSVAFASDSCYITENL